MDGNKFFTSFNRVIAFDTEYTTWEGALERNWSGEDEHREIFQISAVVVDFIKNDITDSFERFVYPRKNPLLSEFAKDLTHISQAQVDNGIDFREMYIEFLAWAKGLPLCSYDPFAGPEGDGEVLKENMELYKLELPYDASRFINLVDVFSETGIEVEKFTSGQLHTCFDVEVPGQVHDALHDVHSIGVSLLAILSERTDLRDELRHK